MTDSVTNKRVATVTRLLRECIGGKGLADRFDCSKGYISQTERNGSGEIKKMVDVIRDVIDVRDMGVVTECQAEQALNELYGLLGDAGGRRFFKPVQASEEVGAYIEVLNRLTGKVGNLLKQLQEAHHPDSPAGTEISDCERESLVKAFRALGEFAAAGEMFASRGN